MCNNIIIANERAYWGLSRSRIRRACNFFQEQQFPFSLFTTQNPGHARQLAKEATDQRADTIIVLGGDGTLNEVINGVLTSACGRLPRIGIVPAGSSNDFSKSLGIPQRLRRACTTIIEGKTTRIDIGQAGPHYFCMASSLGLFSEIAAQSTRMKLLSGSLRYMAAALKVIRKMGPGWKMNVTADGNTFQGTYGVLLVENTKRFGGLTLTPGASPDDGILDCLLIDESDSELAEDIERLGVQVRLTQIEMQTSEDKFKLARAALAACREGE